MLARSLTVLALLAALVPSAAAADPPCAAVTEDVPGAAGWYVVPSSVDPELWREENGVPGLQRVACVDADGAARGSDFLQGRFHVTQPDELPCRVSGRQLVCDG